ncbi:hypothetical protein Nepgr_030049 [Nepenthes gracilis]|uniref:Uncharacterized protein n=1 Tax=Nepenthes gracilis TaxID=150966 RepID=A0AAD3TG24_NEPGR|nr:hypothetical protein Nepgr_030049 [Nepenthes gracilis]
MICVIELCWLPPVGVCCVAPVLMRCLACAPQKVLLDVFAEAIRLLYAADFVILGLLPTFCCHWNGCSAPGVGLVLLSEAMYLAAEGKLIRWAADCCICLFALCEIWLAFIDTGGTWSCSGGLLWAAM